MAFLLTFLTGFGAEAIESPATDVLLLEIGDKILNEDGTNSFLLEEG